MVKPGGGQRESDGAIVLMTAGRNPATGKGPDFGHSGNGGKREGMAGTAQPKYPDGHMPIVKVRQLQNRLWAAAKQSKGRRFHALYDRTYRSDVLWEAWERVRANRGAAGVDGLTLSVVEAYGVERMLAELQDSLRAGTYHPAPVRRVEIPKPDGTKRPLGIPTVTDRVCQQAVKIVLEPIFEADFLSCSFGFRPKRSATDALEEIRVAFPRGKQFVFEADIKDFFDSVPHDLLLKAVAHHTSERWVLLYIERWLKAPMQMPDGALVARDKGTPQGSPVSPVLANLFMHYAFDRWMAREFPSCPFERYADDIVAHCDSEEQARQLRAAFAERLGTLGLELHPDKTRTVYCKDANRRGASEHVSFDFLGYTFRGRLARGPAGHFVSFSPAMSTKAIKAKGLQIRAWHLNRRTGTDLSGLAEDINPQVRGWINYYGAFYRSELYSLVRRIDEHLVRWAMQKFKRFRHKPWRAWDWLANIRLLLPKLFAHWQLARTTNTRLVGAV